MKNPIPLLQNSINARPKLGCLLAGFLTVGALPPWHVWPLLFIAFPWLLLQINRAVSKRRAFACGYWFGFGFFAAGLSWVGNALLIDAAVFGWLYPLVLLAAGGFFGLFTAVPALLAYLFRGLYARWLALAGFWVLSEWLRSFILTGFPWNLLGSVLAFDITLLQAAALIGTYGLSGLVLLAASAPALCLHYRNRTALIISLSIIIGISLLLWGFGSWRLKQYPERAGNLKIRIVQPAIPQQMKWQPDTLEDNFADYISLSRSPGFEDIDFVIWGETASPFPLDLDREHLLQAAAAVPPQGFLITGLVRYGFDPDEGYYRPRNSLLVIGRNGEIAAAYDKSHLVPFGEYIPLRRFLPQWIRPITGAIANFMPGQGPQALQAGNYPSFGGLICYEIIFPGQVAARNPRPEWLVNLTNDGWYGDSAGPYQHLVTTQLRAVEEGLTIVRAANTGISAVISPVGKIIAELGLNRRGFIDANLPQTLTISTAYGKNCNIIPLILTFLNIMLAFYISSRTL